jgi:hypothetical protein
LAVDASLIAADANKQRSLPSVEHPDWRSLAASRRAVREYLDTLDQAAWGAASETVPKFVSPSDSAAHCTVLTKATPSFPMCAFPVRISLIVSGDFTRW